MKNVALRLTYEFILFPLLLGLLRVAASRNQKIREGFRLRRPIDGRAPWALGHGGSRPIWFHCASGEFEYVKPVITEIKRRDPKQTILVTYFSPSARTAIRTFPGVDLHSPAPWDRASSINELIDHHQPCALLVARTDTWPIMLAETHHHGIPSLLFSATFADRAGRLKFFARPFTLWALSYLSEIFCVSEADYLRVKGLDRTLPARVAGDTRFDQVITRLASTKAPPIVTPGRRVMVAGSTWDQDEARLVPLLRRFKGRLVTFIAPHEPTATHLLSLEARVNAAGLRHVRYSTLNAERLFISEETDIVVVDRVGILAELYTSGEFAFVGGSFRRKVHSVMEPLAAGCVTFVGPHHHNNREALDFKTIPLPNFPGPNQRATGPMEQAQTLNCVCEVASSEDWAGLLEAALHSTPGAWRAYINEQVRARCGYSSLVVDWVMRQGADRNS